MIKQRMIVSLAVLIAICYAAQAQEKLYPNMFPLGSVTLLSGPFKKAQDLNTTVLMKYTVGRLLVPFRRDAGLPVQGFQDYPNWDGLNGHIGGHYLSALSMQYAATGNTQCKARLDSMIVELKKCQDANGSDPVFVGYVGGVPDGKTIWRSIKSGNVSAITSGWVPWYNVHKTYAGLRDAWVYGNNTTARTMFLALCDWAMNLCSGLTDNQMQQMLGGTSGGVSNEHGGMNEMFADAYKLTSEIKYLNFAKRFSHQWLLNAMAANNDNLDNAHANTQVPKTIGFQRIGFLGNDNTYKNAANFFWTTVTARRSIAIGGNSEDELFRSAAQCMRYLTERNGVETCNSYNMLKLSELLFCQIPDARYTDFYERALFNHILSTQHPTHGGYCYFTPTHPRHYRVYSAPDVAMWCCVGSGMENHTKYGQFIYTRSAASDSLFVNLFIASELNWAAKGVTVRQETSFPDEEQTRLTVTVTAPTAFKMFIRHPSWARTGEMKVIIGPDTLGRQTQPASYVEVNRTWNNGDVVTVLLPMHFSYEQLINVTGWYALKRGPIVLAAKTDSTVSNMPGLVADASRFGHSPSGTLLDYTTAPKIRLNTYNLDNQFMPIDGQPLSYRAPGIFQNAADSNLVLRPFFRLHNVRYMMYWNTTLYTNVAEVPRLSVTLRPEIRPVKGALRCSFSNADPSRHILLYLLNGKQLADLPAPARDAVIPYAAHGVTLNNGIYMVRVKSRNATVAQKVYIER